MGLGLGVGSGLGYRLAFSGLGPGPGLGLLYSRGLTCSGGAKQSSSFLNSCLCELGRHGVVLVDAPGYRVTRYDDVVFIK